MMKKLITWLMIGCLLIGFRVPTQAAQQGIKTKYGYIEMYDPDTALYINPVRNQRIVRVPDQVVVDEYNVRIIGVKRKAFKSKRIRTIYLGKNVFLIPKRTFNGRKKRIIVKNTMTWKSVKKSDVGKNKLIMR
jgi:hypothetical protein